MRVPRTRKVSILLITAVGVPSMMAGCLGGVPSAEEGPAGEIEPVPTWNVGDWWNYTITDRNATVLGYTLVEVLGTSDILNATAYDVRETVDLGIDGGGNRTSHFDTNNLNRVWDDCGQFGVMGKCRWRLPILDFPLWDGKSWLAHGGSDTPVTTRQTAEQISDARWEITQLAEDRPAGARVLVYEPQIGIVTEEVQYTVGGEIHERWALSETNRWPTPRE